MPRRRSTPVRRDAGTRQGRVRASRRLPSPAAPARQDARPYERLGLPTEDALVFHAHGWLPAQAAALHSACPRSAAWIANTFAHADGLRLLAPTEKVNDRTGQRLRQMHDTDPEEALAWLRSPFRLDDAYLLHTWKVLPSAAERWWEAQPPLRQHARLAHLFLAAQSLYDVQPQDAPGWVDYAVTHRVIVAADAPANGFLGGLTGLFAEAGIRPPEADLLTVTHQVDLDSLRALVALRAMGRG